ncbi:hypothetical protein EYC80_009253 [Monilinia laxa]|uniref:Uncharacterized protein n=1 Tax=Monilinia laxa TaxID=61186 RepID=A0A5N6JXA2_MONLA|nr:hypothetical protein EYC80_009253 [Monilinia laxa]
MENQVENRLENHWPVVDYIGLVEEINAEYKRSDEPLHAGICYQKCEDLLAFIPEHGYFFIAHTHLILALLKDPKDQNSTSTHIHRASVQLRTIQSLPQNAHRANVLDPLSNNLYPDIALLHQYHALITSIYNEHAQFYSHHKWNELSINKIGKNITEKFKMQVYALPVLDKNGECTGQMRKFKEPILPLMEKSEAEIYKDRCETMDNFWRYMCRELMKGVDGRDVRQLGGAQLVGLGGRGVFEFWAEVKGMWFKSFRGYGGVGKKGDSEALKENCSDCYCGRCMEQAWSQGKVLRKAEQATDESREHQIVGIADTTRCGYQWDF